MRFKKVILSSFLLQIHFYLKYFFFFIMLKKEKMGEGKIILFYYFLYNVIVEKPFQKEYAKQTGKIVLITFFIISILKICIFVKYIFHRLEKKKN